MGIRDRSSFSSNGPGPQSSSNGSTPPQSVSIPDAADGPFTELYKQRDRVGDLLPHCHIDLCDGLWCTNQTVKGDFKKCQEKLLSHLNSNKLPPRYFERCFSEIEAMKTVQGGLTRKKWSANGNI